MTHTHTAILEDPQTGERSEIGIPAGSRAEAQAIAERDGLPVVAWAEPKTHGVATPSAAAHSAAYHEPDAPGRSAELLELRRIAQQNDELIHLLRGFRADGMKLSQGTHRKIKSAIGWQVLMAMIVFAVLFPVVLVVVGVVITAAGVGLGAAGP